MKKLNLFCFLICSIVFVQKNCLANTKIPIKITKIYDGDTVEAKINENIFSIRLQGIDCFETSINNRAYKQAYENNIKIEDVIKKGEFARKHLVKLYKNSNEASFVFKGIDKYSRVLGILFFDNLNINNELINEKLCIPFFYKEK